MAIYFSSDYSSEAEFKKEVRARRLRKLARNLWTDESSPDEDVVNRHCHDIVAKIMPGAVINRRSGFSYKPENGVLYVSHSRKRPLQLPGLTVFSDGSQHNREDDDVPLNLEQTLYGASQVRALLENANERGRPESQSSRMSRTELQEKLTHIITSNTDTQNINLLEMVMQRPPSPQRETIKVFIEAIMSARPTVETDSAAFVAATRGKAYDSRRVALFESVVATLNDEQPIQRFIVDSQRSEFAPFYEAYFSNYIEGTQFEVEEAEAIVFQHVDLKRPEDAHDVAATFAIVNDDAEMSRVFTSAAEFMENLRNRHSEMMKLRPTALPGQWKQRANRAGNTVFVMPEFVEGTLEAGWEIGQSISDPFARAVYGMFFVSEVHPFTDGNGRAARITMNNELHAAGMHHIIVPTILRADYNSALTRATAGNGIQGLTRVLNHAQKWVSLAPFDSLIKGSQYLDLTNALLDSAVAERSGKALKLFTLNEIELLVSGGEGID